MEEKQTQTNKEQPRSILKDLAGIAIQSYKETFIPKSKDVLNATATNIIYAITDTIVGIVGKSIYGPDAQIPQSNPQGYDYNARYRNGQQPAKQQQQNVGMRSATSLEYVVASSQIEADKWKAELQDNIRRFGKATVAQLYELSGKHKPLFVDFEYGWTDVSQIHWQRNKDGWWFNLPTPTYLNGNK